MEDNFVLSEKIKWKSEFKEHYVINLEDIKEFIKRLKEMHEEVIEDLHTSLNSWLSYEFDKKLDKLAGDKLI